MKSQQPEPEAEMLPEFDFSGKKGVRGKFYASLKSDGWFGITEEAIKRSPSVGVLGHYPSRLHDDIEPKDPFKEPFYNYGYTRKRYRYRRHI